MPLTISNSDRAALRVAAQPLRQHFQRFDCVLRFAEGQSTQFQLATRYGVTPRCVASWLHQFREGGVPGLWPKAHAGGRRPLLDEGVQVKFRARLSTHRTITPKQAKLWLEGQAGRTFKATQARYWMRKLLSE